jgi:hypothetical protein
MRAISFTPADTIRIEQDRKPMARRLVASAVDSPSAHPPQQLKAAGPPIYRPANRLAQPKLNANGPPVYKPANGLAQPKLKANGPPVYRLANGLAQPKLVPIKNQPVGDPNLAMKHDPSKGLAHVGVRRVTSPTTYLGNRSSLSRRLFSKPAVGTLNIAANPAALGMLGADYGLTWPQRILADIGARRIGDEWEPEVRRLTGDYSIQATLQPGQVDITLVSIPGVVTALNYQAIIAALDNYGDPPAAWYSLAAVQNHESRHATRAHQALDDVAEQIEALVKAVTTNYTAGDNEGIAVTRIQALPAYGAALTAGWNLWVNRMAQLIAGDHHPGGPCEMAEEAITGPLKAEIRRLSIVNRWAAPPVPVPLPVGSLGVNAAAATFTPAPVALPVGPKPQVALPPGSALVSARIWPPAPQGN